MKRERTACMFRINPLQVVGASSHGDLPTGGRCVQRKIAEFLECGTEGFFGGASVDVFAVIGSAFSFVLKNRKKVASNHRGEKPAFHQSGGKAKLRELAEDFQGWPSSRAAPRHVVEDLLSAFERCPIVKVLPQT